MKNTMIALAFIVLAFIAAGCQPSEQETASEPIVEEPSIAPGEILVDEEVIVPAHEPEPVPEPIIEPKQGNILTEFKDSRNFMHGRPDVGDVVSDIPRKVTLVFRYPIMTGTEIEVWDENEEINYHLGKNTIIADEDSLVAIAYLSDMGPGIYKVKYTAVFVTSKEGTDTGYYYFKVE